MTDQSNEPHTAHQSNTPHATRASRSTSVAGRGLAALAATFAAVSITALSGGCGGRPVAVVPGEPEATSVGGVVRPRVEYSGRADADGGPPYAIVRGEPMAGWAFDGLERQRPPLPGDAVLVEAVIVGKPKRGEAADGQRERVRLLVEVALPNASSPGGFAITMSGGGERETHEIPLRWVELSPVDDGRGTDNAGVEWGYGMTPEMGLLAGPVEYHRHRWGDGLDADVRLLGPMAAHMWACTALKDNGDARRMLEMVADRPGLLSIATHAGVRVEIRGAGGDPVDVRPAWIGLGDAGTYGVHERLELVANGRLAATIDAYAAPIRGPLGLTNGLVHVELRNATDPGRYAVLRVVGTRGAEPAGPAEGAGGAGGATGEP